MDLAYAMTVHKSQGSEAPVVVCVCTALHDFNLSRNLLYTGVSRARKACYIVGDMQSARKAARKVEDLRRRTVFSVAFGTWTDLVGQTAPALKLEDDGWSDES
jgi:exodeoxyribonuclease V alpha subunit